MSRTGPGSSPLFVPKSDHGSVPAIVLQDSSEAPSRPKSPTPSMDGKKDPSSAVDKLRSLQASASSRIKDRFRGSETRTESPRGMQDRLMNLVFQQIIPSDAGIEERVDAPSKVERPQFSIPAMSNNFRRFNARIGVVFALQRKIIDLFSWQHPSHTLSFLFIYTFTCLDPAMIIVVPISMILYFVMFPSFLTRHPPPPQVPLTSLYPLTGPALAPPNKIKPAPELSKDFFHNMRDLQNSMDDFSQLYDWVIAHIVPLTSFANEHVSSALFICLFSSCLLLFLIAHLVPWRLLALFGGWIMILSNHPTIQILVAQITANPETPLSELDKETSTRLMTSVESFATSDIMLGTTPGRREVEIFELQHRPISISPSASSMLNSSPTFHYFHSAQVPNSGSSFLQSSASTTAISTSLPPPTIPVGEWLPVLWSPSPYTPTSPARVAGQRPNGAKNFEEVKAPAGWRWASKKWSLDLLAKEWVEERYLAGVQVEVEGGRWVVDILPDQGADSPGTSGEKWRYGEWRRRRWVRVVERIVNKGEDS